ncbi:hypothetical protein AEP_00689 [Curvibacter sp. AEP1-3]|nr:hypothetical protein AEP_00689 [Curvibacter sp. AEP1-3]
MGLFRKLLEWLSPKPKHLKRKWDPHTNPIDIRSIEKDLKLREEGARLGAAGIPLPSDAHLCGPETKALLAIEQARTDYVEWGQLRLKSLNGELTRLDVSPSIHAGEDSANEFERLASVRISANAPEIRRLESIASSRREAFERFREANQRHELPHYPQGWHKALRYVVALALIAVEAVANSQFFAQGLSGGLLQGFVQALVAAALNVAVSFAAGHLLVKYVHHVKPVKVVLGVISIVVLLCFILGLGLLVAHYREALVLGLENAESAALEAFLIAPFRLTEVSSMVLLLVSVGFALVAVFDGYKLDDSYPGYGKEHRKLLEAEEAYSGGLDSLQDMLEELKTAQLEKVDFALAHSETAIVSIKNVISDKDRCRDDLSNMIADSPSMLSALLAEFRTENMTTRQLNGHATPNSFSSQPALHELRVPNFDTTADLESLAKQEALLMEFRLKAPQIRAHIQSGFTAHFNSLRTLSSHFEAENNGTALAS